MKPTKQSVRQSTSLTRTTAVPSNLAAANNIRGSKQKKREPEEETKGPARQTKKPVPQQAAKRVVAAKKLELVEPELTDRQKQVTIY
jgi:hypothetical protein